MPAALEPGIKVPVVLKCDRDKPIESRPTFFARSISMRKEREIRELLEWVADSQKKSEKEAEQRILAMLKELVVGWKNLVDPISNDPIEFSLEDIDAVLGLSDAYEILNLIYIGGTPDAVEKKSSESPA